LFETSYTPALSWVGEGGSDLASLLEEEDMPLVRIDLPAGTPQEHRSGIAEVVYDALTTVAGAPAKTSS
jgi:Tautomerase enzyme